MLIYESIIRFFYLLVGCLYPAFASFKILNGNDNDTKSGSNTSETQRKWLSYWIVYGIYITVDFLIQKIEAFIPLPFLMELKLLFLCWLLPSMGGGHKLIYDEFICSFLKQNEYSIDQAIVQASKTGTHLLGKFLSLTFRHLITIGESFLCLIRRNHQTKIGHLRLTPSVEVIIGQILAKRRGKHKKGSPSNQSHFDLFKDVHEDQTSEYNKEPEYGDLDNLLNYKVTQPPPNPPPKPKKKQSSDIAIPSSLNGIIHEHNGFGNRVDMTQ